ncbi:hypothetical protein HMPREF0877_1357 [Weissella paramesenteroides ATCC 33313]|uniref:Uncharacterized protein n=1 Tax=Weissella paramesenteroides ATCC 33313 TaxID=585506 RepID=C5RBL1_WEIPA|nr:hypothetical protein HMPREF0877_1357 [Weissella paramesenteroides ATCC 33313]
MYTVHDEPIKVANKVITDSKVIGLLKNNANCTPKIKASIILPAVLIDVISL